MGAKAFALSVVIGAALGKGYLSTFKTASQKASHFGAAIADSNKKLDATKSVLKYRKILEKLKAKQTELGHSTKYLDTHIAKVEKRYKKAKATVKGYGIEMATLGRTQEKLIRQNKLLIRQQKAMRGKQAAADRMGSLKGAAIGAGAAMWGMSNLIGGANDFGEASVRLGTVINADDVEASVQAARKHASDFSRRTLAVEGEMINIEYALNSSGLDSKAARIGSEIVHKVAKVTNGQAEGVGEIIGGVYNNFGSSLEGDVSARMTRIGDILTKAQFKYQIRDFNQLGESFKAGAKGAIKYNVPLDQTAAILGQLNSSMVVGSSAGTAMNAILRQMSKGAQEFGYEIVRSENGQMDMIATLGNLKESLTIFDDPDEKADAIQKVFGDEGGAVSLLIAKMEALNSGFESVRDGSKNVVDDAYERFINDDSGKQKMAIQNIVYMGRAFATTLLPAVSAVASPLGKLTGWAGGAMEDYPAIGRIIGALGGGVLAFGGVVAGVTALQWAWNVAMMANPIGLIVGAVAAVGVAAWALYENWDDIWSGMMSVADGASEMISDLFSWMTDGDDPVSKKSGQGVRRGAVAGAAMAAVVAAPTPDVLAQPMPAAQQVVQQTKQTTNHNSITIHQQPGQDARSLAEEVQRHIAKEQSGALYD